MLFSSWTPVIYLAHDFTPDQQSEAYWTMPPYPYLFAPAPLLADAECFGQLLKSSLNSMNSQTARQDYSIQLQSIEELQEIWKKCVQERPPPDRKHI